MMRRKRTLFGLLLCTGVLVGVSAHGAPSSNPAEAFARANKLAAEGNSVAAEKIYRALIAEDPKRPEPYNNLAMLYARKGELNKARSLLERAMRTRDAYATVYDNLSTIYVAMARNSYAKALRIDQKSNRTKLQALADLSEPRRAPLKVAAAAPAKRPAPAATAHRAAAHPVSASTAAPKRTAPKAAPATAAAKPAAVAGAASPLPAIEAALHHWAVAWAGQDIKGYLGAYAPDFRPVGGASHARWVAQRRARLKHPQSIHITVDDLKVTLHGPDRATVRFMQHYRAPRYRDRTLKQLRMHRVDGKWLIERERNLKVWRGR